MAGKHAIWSRRLRANNRRTRPPTADRGAESQGEPADETSSGHFHDPRPLKSYVGIMASYGGLTAALTLLLRRERFRVRPLSPWNFLLYALAAEHLSRLISKDSVTSAVRKPFTEFKGRPARVR